MGAVMEVGQLSLLRGGRPVLHSVSASFQRACVTAVVGPSGSGKTSLLRCLNRLEEPNSGRVFLNGVDIRSLAATELRRRVALIFQQPVLFDGDVHSNLVYGLKDVDQGRVMDALRSAGLPESFERRDATAISVGQAQRVAIARALVRDPEVLLMDEPTSALDKDAAARIEQLIGDLVKTGLTVVWVTHNLFQARRVADQALLLVDGRVIATGSTNDIEAKWQPEVKGGNRK
jgi:putative ABC transport system ATP-binding protein